MTLLKRLTVGVVTVVVLGYLGLAGALYAQQRRPDPTRLEPASAGFTKGREVMLSAAGQPRLIGWHAPAAADKPVILYLHGNAANLGRRGGRFEALTREGAGLLALSWRGYGGSEGEPSEAGFHEDVAQALDFLKREGVGPNRIVLFGESLGTGMAVMTAARLSAAATPVKGLILDSPYESIASIAGRRYWWLPVDLLLRDPFRADQAASAIAVPTLAIHCTEDWVTPYEGGRRLLDLIKGPKKLVTVEGRCHVPPFSAGGGEAIRVFLGELK
jgi:uncharacterized protein